MGTITDIFKTIIVSFVFVVLRKVVSLLYKKWLKLAIKLQKKYNKKHRLHKDYNMHRFDTVSMTYQLDMQDGNFIAMILFLILILIILIIPSHHDILFNVLAVILSVLFFLYCWFVRQSWAKNYRMLFYISCGVSVLLTAHIVVSLIWTTVIVIGYSNSIHLMLLIWSTMLFEITINNDVKKRQGTVSVKPKKQ